MSFRRRGSLSGLCGGFWLGEKTAAATRQPCGGAEILRQVFLHCPDAELQEFVGLFRLFEFGCFGIGLDDGGFGWLRVFLFGEEAADQQGADQEDCGGYIFGN